MCGRYLIQDPAGLLRPFRLPELREIPRDLVSRFNLAPTQRAPIVRRAIVRQGRDGDRELAMASWGLVPAWADDPAIGGRMINARAETLAEKPAFRAAFRSRRCVVPASGFYEWKRQGGGPKQPFLIRRRDGGPMGLAGLWEAWTDRATGEVVETFAIVTCPPNELMAELHDRMPVILDPTDYDAWLNPADQRAGGLLRPCPAEWLEAVPVSTRVNSPANDDEDLTRPVGEPVAAQGSLL